MIVSLIITLILLIAIGYAAYKYVGNLSNYNDYGDTTSQEVDVDISYLIKEVSETISKSLRQRFEDENLTREELFQKSQRVSSLRESIDNASHGDKKARRIIKNHIKDILNKEKYAMDVNIDKVIPFGDDEKLKALDRFEILMFLYGRLEDDNAFSAMMDDYDLTEPEIDENGEQSYRVSKEKIKYVYEDVMSGKNDRFKKSDLELNHNDKMDILTQRIFENYLGFGPVDILYQMAIDEIDCGVSGIPSATAAVKSNNKNMPYAYESVWVMYHGLKIHLECLSFGTWNELIRVTDNVYLYDAKYVMSKTDAKIVATMIDGSRITACRPPFADNYEFYLRKFDSSTAKKASDLIKGIDAEIAIVLLYWIVKGEQTMGVTGSQGCGKTTLLRMIIGFINPSYALRVQEISPELNLRYTFPNRNISTFVETEAIPAQEGLNFQKKSNGDVNIIGEVASAEQATYVIQTAMVASLMTLFTHHAKTARAFVEAIANNLLESGVYSDKADAVRMTAKVLNIDCHLNKFGKKRSIERITEIIPTEDQDYPSVEMKNASVNEATYADAREYFKRSTNPDLFETRQLIHREAILDNGEEIGQQFVLDNLPSEAMIANIMSKLSYQDKIRFERDIKMIKRVSDGQKGKDIEAWKMEVLSY